nr:MAG TPA: hypothetical protein [Caudoviricetes sp.]
MSKALSSPRCSTMLATRKRSGDRTLPSQGSVTPGA